MSTRHGYVSVRIRRVRDLHNHPHGLDSLRESRWIDGQVGWVQLVVHLHVLCVSPLPFRFLLGLLLLLLEKVGVFATAVPSLAVLAVITVAVMAVAILLGDILLIDILRAAVLLIVTGAG